MSSNNDEELDKLVSDILRDLPGQVASEQNAESFYSGLRSTAHALSILYLACIEKGIPESLSFELTKMFFSYQLDLWLRMAK